MGIVFRQSIKGTLVLFFGVLLGAAFTYLTSLIIPLQALGGSRNMLTQGAVCQLFFLMGTGSLIQTFSQRYLENDPRKPVLVTLSLCTPILTAILFSIPYFLFRGVVLSRYQIDDRPFLDRYYALTLGLSIILSYMTLLEHYLASQYKIAASVFMREVVLRIGLLLLLGAFWLQWISFHYYIIGMVLVHIIPLAGLVFLSKRTNGFYISNRWSVFSKAEYKEIVHYSWYHMLTGVSLNLLSFLDVLIIPPLAPAGLGAVPVYTNAQFFVALMMVPYRAMAGAAFPKLNEAWLSRDTDRLNILFNRAGLNMLVVAVGMWLLVCSNMHNAVALFPPQYAQMLPIVLILSIGRMVDMSTGLNTELISITNYYKFNFRMSVILLVSVLVFDRIFIPKAGIFGAAWVASLTLVAFNIVKMIYLYSKTGLHPFSKGSIIVILAGALAFCAGWLMPHLSNPFVDAAIRSALVLAIWGGILFVLKPVPDLTHFLKEMRKNKRLF